MTLTLDNIKEPIEFNPVELKTIESNLNKLNGKTISFAILTDTTTNSYIQCAGNKTKLTVELRHYNKNTFKHYVLGKKVNKKNVAWTQIHCKVGPINLQLNEVLTLKDAEELFANFLEGKSFSKKFMKRNITKIFFEKKK